MGFATEYIILLLVLLVISVTQLTVNWNERSQRFFKLLVLSIILAFYGTRGFIQTDFVAYYYSFDKMPLSPVAFLKHLVSHPKDFGFTIYCYLIKVLFRSYFAFTFISTLIDLVLLTWFFNRYLPDKIFAFFIVIFIYYYGSILELNLMRNVKSILIFCLSIKYIYNRQLTKFLIVNLIGLTFHWSAIVFFPLYFFIHKPTSEKRYWILFAVSIIIYFISPVVIHKSLYAIGKVSTPGIAERINAYLSEEMLSQGRLISFGDMIRCGLAVVVGVNFKRLIQEDNRNAIWINLYIIYFLLSMLSHGMTVILSRWCCLFAGACWILYPKLVLIQKNSFTKCVYISCFSLICLSGLFIQVKNEPINEYDSWMFSKEKKSFEERVQILTDFQKEKWQKK